MMSPNSSDTQSNPNHELTLGDVIGFIAKAKWFVLVGVVIGAVIASIYLAIIPPVYQSSITIQINNTNGANAVANTTEFVESFPLDKNFNELLSLIQPEPSTSIKATLNDAIKSATISKTGNLLTFNVKTNSAVDSQELAAKLANGAITIIDQLRAPNIANLQKNLTLKKALLASANSTKDTFNLQLSIIELEILLSSQSNSKPSIVNGPTISSSPISPKRNPILLLGALLGLALGLALFYLKDNFKNK
jgi:capsular polysaccharide biosynthesis protein